MQTIIDGQLLSGDRKPKAYGALQSLVESINRWKEAIQDEDIHDSSLLVVCLNCL
jgi:hypothetical protein